MSADTPTPTPDQRDFRDLVRNYADELGVPVKDVLFQSAGRDPLNKGTSADHDKGRWFQELWREATDNRDGSAIHIRGLHYVVMQLERDVEPPTDCSWDRYQNIDKCYDYLTEAGVAARVLGYVPLGGIIDEKNNQITVNEYDEHSVDPSLSGYLGSTADGLVSKPTISKIDEVSAEFSDTPDAIEDIAETVRRRAKRHVEFDTVSQQPYHIELWSEKALPEAVRQATEKSGVNAIVEGQGHLSYTVAHDFVQRVEEAGKPAVVFFLADFDPAGDTMPGAMASKVSWMDLADTLNERIIISRLALTADQVERYDLPREPLDPAQIESDAYESMSDEWTDRHDGVVELSALEANLDNYCRIVRDGVSSVTDGTIYEQNEERLEEYLDYIEDLVTEELENRDDLDDTVAAVEEWVEEANNELKQTRETIDSLREIINQDPRLDEFKNAVDDTVENLDHRAIDPPEGEADPPENPLYDSQRPYLDNLSSLTGGES